MTEDDKMQLFMPIVISSLTNAVYSCQLLKQDLNSEQAITDVMLTWHRLSEVLCGQIEKSLSRDIRFGKMLDAELKQTQEKLTMLSSQSPNAETLQAMQILVAEAELLEKIAEFLKKDQEKYG